MTVASGRIQSNKDEAFVGVGSALYPLSPSTSVSSFLLEFEMFKTRQVCTVPDDTILKSATIITDEDTGGPCETCDDKDCKKRGSDVDFKKLTVSLIETYHPLSASTFVPAFRVLVEDECECYGFEGFSMFADDIEGAERLFQEVVEMGGRLSFGDLIDKGFDFC